MTLKVGQTVIVTLTDLLLCSTYNEADQNIALDMLFEDVKKKVNEESANPLVFANVFSISCNQDGYCIVAVECQSGIRHFIVANDDCFLCFDDFLQRQKCNNTFSIGDVVYYLPSEVDATEFGQHMTIGTILQSTQDFATNEFDITLQMTTGEIVQLNNTREIFLMTSNNVGMQNNTNPDTISSKG